METTKLVKMKDTEKQVDERSLAKALIAGAVAGLVATAAKMVVDRLFPENGSKRGPKELVVGRNKLTPVVSHERPNWGFGAVVGAAYGAVAEFYPAATAKEGASFGLALGTLMESGALAIDPMEPKVHQEKAQDQTLREKTSEMSSHLAFGVAAETVRRVVRRAL